MHISNGHPVGPLPPNLNHVSPTASTIGSDSEDEAQDLPVANLPQAHGAMQAASSTASTVSFDEEAPVPVPPAPGDVVLQLLPLNASVLAWLEQQQPPAPGAENTQP